MVKQNKTTKKNNRKLVIKESEVGTDYLNALEPILNIRKERAKIYGNDWSHPLDVEVWELYQKVFRLKKLYEDDKKGLIHDYEKMEDVARDISNYGIFLLIKLDKRKKRHDIK